MDNYTKPIEQRIALLQRAISTAERELKDHKFPDGRLRISSVHGYPRWFCISGEDEPKEFYISKRNINLAKALAQKEYNKDFLRKARDELNKLKQTSALLYSQESELVFDKTNEARRKLIMPYIVSDEQFAKDWLEKPFKSSTYLPENKKYETKRGDMVRSKSEAIIADILCDLGIPYRYECALILKGNMTKYPDFTLLKKSTREEIYLEHFGLLDDEEYRNNFFEKLEEYRKNGIYPGKNLLFTYETEAYPLDIKGIRRMLKEVLL